MLLFRSGFLFACAAVCLQIAVFLQPLLPVQYQISPVCETIAQALLSTQSGRMPDSKSLDHHPIQHHDLHSPSSHDHHDANHQCQYCVVYANLILPTDLDLEHILLRVQVRLIAFQQTYRHVYYFLQRLFLLPQGRAPPLGP